jgi:hypothetical protein
MLYIHVFKIEGYWETWWEGHWGMLEKPQDFDLETTRATLKKSWVLKKLMFY